MNTQSAVQSDMSWFAPTAPEATESKIQRRLPVWFDKTCNNNTCGKTMEFMVTVCHTRRKPFATYQCPHCKTRLLIFDAPITPMFVWSSEYAGVVNFSYFIESKLLDRERKRKRRFWRFVLGLLSRIGRALS